ncbi:MAG: hypothetical protein ABI921_04265 [Panacibacter sp.]
MTFEEILRSPKLDLYNKKDYEGDFKSFLSSLFNQYLGLLENLRSCLKTIQHNSYGG